MPTIDPNPGQFKAAMEKIPVDTPIMMLNMLRFRDQANYSDKDEAKTCSGIEAYQRYSDASFPKIKAVGGSIALYADVLTEMIAPDDEKWDKVFVVNWPSYQVFLDIVMSKEYQSTTFHRSAALLDSRLIMLKA